jgi:hypothetical protein
MRMRTCKTDIGRRFCVLTVTFVLNMTQHFESYDHRANVLQITLKQVYIGILGDCQQTTDPVA